MVQARRLSTGNWCLTVERGWWPFRREDTFIGSGRFWRDARTGRFVLQYGLGERLEGFAWVEEHKAEKGEGCPKHVDADNWEVFSGGYEAGFKAGKAEGAREEREEIARELDEYIATVGMGRSTLLLFREWLAKDAE